MQAPLEVGLATILETTEIQESFNTARSRNATYIDYEHEISEFRETDLNINSENEDEADTSATNTVRRDSVAPDATRRKSVTFSERLTQEKKIEELTKNSSKSNIKIMVTQAPASSVTQSEVILDSLQDHSDQNISKLNIPRPILKVKEKQTTEELAGSAAQRKSMIRSNRKSSLGGDNSSGDRRRSRIYSIGGNGMNAPLISDEALREAQAELMAENAVMEEAIGEVVDRTLVDDMVTEPVEIEEVCKVAEEEVVLLTDVT